MHTGLQSTQGPLKGLKVLEIEALGPVPFAAMMMSDLGADVLRLCRPEASAGEDYNASEDTNFVNRGRIAARVDLKSPAGVQQALEAITQADVLLEGFRPGVMERLGLGPGECMAANPGLIYTRVTGWGQTGPLSSSAGHDLNYIALNGTLDLFGASEGPPIQPLNIVGDYAGGAMLGVVGVLAALLERARSGAGQVVDTAIIDGSAMLSAFVWGQHAAGLWRPRGGNFLDGAAPYYRAYETADGRHVAIAAIEDRFFAEFLKISGLPADLIASRRDRSQWVDVAHQVGDFFGRHSAAEITELFEKSDACVTVVRSLDEAAQDAHVLARATFDTSDGFAQPNPAPRFSRTPGSIRGASRPTEFDAVESAIVAWSHSGDLDAR